MKKYLTIFSLSFQNEFTYRLNFVLWRVRNVLRILMTFFLWHSIFSSNKAVFGYSQEQMFAYVFLVLVISSFVMAAPSNDNVGGEISSGDLSNFLLKPFGYLRYWLTRDIASKCLNLVFATLEISLLWFFLRPAISLSSNPMQIVVGVILCFIAALLFYVISKIAISMSFWNPEDTWSIMFLILIFIETAAGMIFPLDILTHNLQNIFQSTPFPYMLYNPIAVLVGRVSLASSYLILLKSCAWLTVLYLFLTFIWKKGLRVYAASGR